jgi:transcriptional regulator with XRE-family HTH domain
LKNEKLTDNNFSDAVRVMLEEKNITYRDLAMMSKVSKTYLTEILVHYRVPSMEIIKKIAKALRIDPGYFKEFRILEVFELLKKFSSGMNTKDINDINKILNKIKDRTKGENISITNYATGKSEMSFEPMNLVNLLGMSDHQVKMVKTMIKQFKEVNEDEFYQRVGEDSQIDSMEGG